MSLQCWLQNLRSALAPGQGQRHPPRRGSLRAGARRPHLEVLEDRLTPSFSQLGESYDQPAVSKLVWESPFEADFTSDGILDEIRSDVFDVVVHPRRSDGTFGEPIRTRLPFSPWGAGLMAAADFNGDGQVDVVTAGLDDFDDPRAIGSVLLGNGNGTFNWVQFYQFNSLIYPAIIGTGDFYGTGRTDIAVIGIDYTGAQLYGVLVNNGDWGPSPPPPPVAPNLSIDDMTVTEGNAGAVSATFTVRLSVAGSEAITVDYATADGAATGGDYQAASGTLTFAPGETSKTIAVLVNGDRLAEPIETFVVNLSGPTNATIVNGQGWGTIFDDEPRISINNVTKSEGRRGRTTLFTFTVTLSAAYDQPVTMSFRTVDGTATTGDGDYVAKTGTLTFAPGETTKTITIEVKGDRRREANETFYLDLFGLSSNALFTKGRGMGTILNDD